MERAHQATVEARTKELWGRWQHMGREGTVPHVGPLSNDELRELLALLETAVGVWRGINDNGHFPPSIGYVRNCASLMRKQLCGNGGA